MRSKREAKKHVKKQPQKQSAKDKKPRVDGPDAGLAAGVLQEGIAVDALAALGRLVLVQKVRETEEVRDQHGVLGVALHNQRQQVPDQPQDLHG